MYPITHNWKKSLTSMIVLGVFGGLMVLASRFPSALGTVDVSSDFLSLDVSYVNHVQELTQIGLVRVSDTDSIGTYIVKRGDTLSGIASRHGTTVAQLKKNNNIHSGLKPGQKLFITDANGIIHIAKEKTNYLLFAHKYNIDLEDLLAVNYAPAEDAAIEKGTELFLPITIEKAYVLGLEERPKPKPQPVIAKRAPKPKPKPQPRRPQPKPTTRTPTKKPVAVARPSTTPSAKPTKPTAPSKPVKTSGGAYAGKIEAVRRDNSRRVSNGFYGGYCTYWAAKRRPDIFPYKSPTVQAHPFIGHARSWLTNAARAGFATGYSPRPGAIAVFRGGGGGYGHVGIVLKIDWDKGIFLMEEMNGPRGKRYVDHRWIRIKGGGVSGYIY